MNNAELARIVGGLEARVGAVESIAARTEKKVDQLVNANTLAKGGKKMLYKVGAVCGTIGGVFAWAFEHAAKLFA